MPEPRGVVRPTFEDIFCGGCGSEEDKEGREESCGGDGGEDVVRGYDFDAGFKSVMGAGLALHVKVGLAGCVTKWCITGNDGLHLQVVCSLYDHILVRVEVIL